MCLKAKAKRWKKSVCVYINVIYVTLLRYIVYIYWNVHKEHIFFLLLQKRGDYIWNNKKFLPANPLA